MRKAAVLGAAVAVVVLASCTYDVPDLRSAARDGGAADGNGLVDAVMDHADGQADAQSDGQSGMLDGSDTGSGNMDAKVTGDAACTGVLCPCNNDTDCSPTVSPICAQQITVGQPVYAAAGGTNFCTAPCCTSADCPAGSVCFASGVGGQYCVNPAWVGRSIPSAAALGGAVCSTDADCRSGLCAGGSCADTCCSLASSAAECAGGALCTFGPFPGKTSIDTQFAPRCGPPSGAGGDGAFCTVNGDCQGGLCAQGLCTSPCRTTGECNPGSVCDFDSSGADIYWACFPETEGTGAEGDPCSGVDSQCASNWCGPNGLCENECFTDADCSVSGWTCMPEPNTTHAGSYVFLICQPG
jgi:hypothetical protein